MDKTFCNGDNNGGYEQDADVSIDSFKEESDKPIICFLNQTQHALTQPGNAYI